jgi:hypothetical protein
MQGEHTPARVAGSRVEGVRVSGLEPADEPDQLWGCSARSSAMDKPMTMMASSLALRSLLSSPRPRRECRAMAVAWAASWAAGECQNGAP